MKCNIFNPLDKNNGEFYMFAQYADDCTREDALKTAYRVVPARFAALEITLPKDNVDQYIAETFQDYENRVLFMKSQVEWSPEMANNLLWKSLEEAGFITPTNYTTTDGTVNLTTYKELNFIGNINIYNSKRYNDMYYNEIYCHIGSSDRSKYYNMEMVGEERLFDYFQSALLGWEGYEVLPNGTENLAKTTASQYSLFGNYIPNVLDSTYDDRYIDVERPSSAENITINIKQEGIGTVFFQKGSEEMVPVTFNDGETFTFTMSNDVREVTIYPNLQNVFIDGLLYSAEDTNMTGIGTVYQNSEKGVLIDPQVGSIRITNNNEDSFKINTLILFYDIYNNLDPENPVLLYKNVPMGVYFVGKYDVDTEALKNTIIKYSNNDDVFGQGSSYNLRICTRNVVTPQGMLKYDTQVVGGEEGYDNLSSVMGGLHDLITASKTDLHTTAIKNQEVKDHLAAFKGFQTNIPYIRNVNGIPTWFVNGRNMGVASSVQGAQGPAGERGPMGYAGSNGVQGPQGPAGKDGTGGGSSLKHVEYLQEVDGGSEISFTSKQSEMKIIECTKDSASYEITLGDMTEQNTAIEHTIILRNSTDTDIINKLTFGGDEYDILEPEGFDINNIQLAANTATYIKLTHIFSADMKRQTVMIEPTNTFNIKQ